MKEEIDNVIQDEEDEEDSNFRVLTIFEVIELIFNLIIWCLIEGVMILAASITLFTIYDILRVNFDWAIIPISQFFGVIILILISKYLVDHHGPRSKDNIMIRFIKTTNIWKVLRKSTFIAIAWVTGLFCTWLATGGHLLLCRFFRWVCP
ncbi:MAG: hypothetical protein WCJ59_02530 [bacterium]